MDKHGDHNPLADAVQLAIKNHLGVYDSGVAPMATTTQASAVAPKSTVSTDADAPAALPTPTVPAASAEEPPAVASSSLQESAASASIEPIAQSVATQLGCGAVEANGDMRFIAPCGTYSVLIDCADGQCRPAHTVNVKHDE
ncbi:hypothetical protein GCM10007898_08870 [Dyella flagellata]|uniref:Uncharacterized protein n=1 Tax=Dyella flagellata TaxID=1867833 RepID=A0ABQ5X9G6_9GAMM|nr:hypothetical protein GCM10007898_08870 [Dyella flagellata]